MIARLDGVLVEREGTRCVVDCGGVGYEVTCSGWTLMALPAVGERVVLRVFTHAKENDITLYGFLEPQERTLFFRYTLPTRRQRAVRQGDWKLMVDGPNPMLFNVAADPGERIDLAAARQDLVARLFPLIAPWEADVDAEAKAAEGK